MKCFDDFEVSLQLTRNFQKSLPKKLPELVGKWTYKNQKCGMEKAFPPNTLNNFTIKPFPNTLCFQLEKYHRHIFVFFQNNALLYCLLGNERFIVKLRKLGQYLEINLGYCIRDRIGCR